ncbi:uncharacterized protein LOC142986531 [Anticarsia gemmatalis]|uniref:uncharacterized protein LOC142986531 n=1 Tax=Anticarsia gemmatalis TaxID=129554 RepID=UPI003F77572A
MNLLHLAYIIGSSIPYHVLFAHAQGGATPHRPPGVPYACKPAEVRRLLCITCKYSLNDKAAAAAAVGSLVGRAIPASCRPHEHRYFMLRLRRVCQFKSEDSYNKKQLLKILFESEHSHDTWELVTMVRSSRNGYNRRDIIWLVTRLQFQWIALVLKPILDAWKRTRRQRIDHPRREMNINVPNVGRARPTANRTVRQLALEANRDYLGDNVASLAVARAGLDGRNVRRRTVSLKYIRRRILRASPPNEDRECDKIGPQASSDRGNNRGSSRSAEAGPSGTGPGTRRIAPVTSQLTLLQMANFRFGVGGSKHGRLASVTTPPTARVTFAETPTFSLDGLTAAPASSQPNDEHLRDGGASAPAASQPNTTVSGVREAKPAPSTSGSTTTFEIDEFE